MNETNKFEVSFGSTVDDMVSVPLSIQGKTIARQGETKHMISLSGIYAANGYLQDSRISISAKKSAIEVMTEKALANGFNIPLTNLKKSSDSQVWIQPNISDKKFVSDELWLHSDLNGGIPAIGISSQGDFIVKDLKQAGATKPIWNFKYNPSAKNEIAYDGDYVTNDSTGFINSWMGYGREKIVYDLEEGEQSTLLTRSTPVVAMTNKIARSTDVNKRFSRVAMLTDDMHVNYWIAHNFNMTNLAVLSSVKITLSFHSKYIPIKVLDHVFFADDDVKHHNQAVATFHAGIYFVTKVARNVGRKQITTVVELCRESLNDIKTKANR